jgi:hypothetical protein
MTLNNPEALPKISDFAVILNKVFLLILSMLSLASRIETANLFCLKLTIYFHLSLGIVVDFGENKLKKN